VFERLRQRRETRRRGAEDANRLAKPRHKGEPPSAPDPVEGLSIIARIPPHYSAPRKLLISKGAADGAKTLQIVRKLAGFGREAARGASGGGIRAVSASLAA